MTSSSSDFQEYDPSTYWVAPARNFRTSARLHLQHLLFQNTLGHLLEPHVESSIKGSKHLKVADLGCGNGVWLSDLAHELSKKGISAQLDGYDVNPVNFPAPTFLPSSINLKKLDVLARHLPAEMIGAYDIVHVRAFVSIIVNSDPTDFLSTALALLKPGGWLQWEESRADHYFVESPTPDVSKSACETIIHMLKTGGEARGFKFDFLAELDQHLTKHGFQDVSMQTVDKRRQDLKAWTEDYLMVWEELGVLFPPKATAPQAPLSRESWVDLFGRAVKETEDGVVVSQGNIVSVVGRKAT
ncbi:hypothetical protein F5X99DRAFT_430959 [Biscogniauxia marginata]|nr:hypothetical protein F5X99DRAFT_430959 [Biscogniauxia marginata]